MLQMPSTSTAPTIEADEAFDLLSSYIGRVLKLEGLTFNGDGHGNGSPIFSRAAELAAVYGAEQVGSSLTLDFITSANSKRVIVDPSDFLDENFQISLLTDGAWKLIHTRRKTAHA